ncbi:MAG: ATP-dependent Clp protease ATP-binding subunit [bacterium]|nr:ATP-dependent Clp protease ATP-binding subunit [bacterium]
MAERQIDDESRRRIERLDQESLEARLRDAAQALQPDRIMDDLEVRHLTRVITECSLLLTDVYSEERLLRIMHPERGFLANLIDQLIEKQRQGEGEALYLVRRLPEDVRVVGDKALFDIGLLGLRQVKGYDLEELGARAYRMAGEALELLAEDRRLHKFFKENRLLMLPLEQEVTFMRQCAERFRVYAEILRGTGHDLPESMRDVAARVPLMAAAAEALTKRDEVTALVPVDKAEADAYVQAARGESATDGDLSEQQALSIYERLLLFSSLDIAQLGHALNATVVDQTRAVETLCDEFSLFAAGTRDLRKPPAYFLVGPTGVGKNHLVESLCRLLEGVWNTEIPALTIEGPNYTYPSDINELRGATRGFIRSDEEGLLTAFHERSSRAPFSVILVDEVEKAHSQLLTFFLSILDRGTTTDNRGNVLNFSNSMLFFTSNLGYSDAQQRSVPVGFMDEDARDVAIDTDIRKELRHALKPEFVNRVRMVHFNRLTRSSAERILDLEFDRIARRYAEVHGLRVVLDDSAREELIGRGFSPTYGARHLAATLESVCNVEIAKKVSQDDRRREGDRGLLQWIREIRSGERAAEPGEVGRRVLEHTRARLDYDTLHVVCRDGEFDYVPENSREPS